MPKPATYPTILLENFYEQDFDALPAASKCTRHDIERFLGGDPARRGVVVCLPDRSTAIWSSAEGQEGGWCVQDLPLEEPDASQFDTMAEAVGDVVLGAPLG